VQDLAGVDGAVTVGMGAGHGDLVQQ